VLQSAKLLVSSDILLPLTLIFCRCKCYFYRTNQQYTCCTA